MTITASIFFAKTQNLLPICVLMYILIYIDIVEKLYCCCSLHNNFILLRDVKFTVDYIYRLTFRARDGERRWVGEEVGCFQGG